MKPLLDVMIVTHGYDGLKRVREMNLPTVAGVRYVVSWQKAGQGERCLPDGRTDVCVFETDSVGSGANRNCALGHAEAEIGLFADNDLKYTAEQLLSVIKTFDAHPEVDVAVFKYKGSAKDFPDAEVDLSAQLPKGFSVGTIQMAVRLSKVKGCVQFDPRFGAGAKYECAEDNLFLHDCRKAGLNCRYFPVEITEHPQESTGTRPIVKASIAQGEGIYIRYVYGIAGLPRIPLVVWREWKKKRIRLLWGLSNYLIGFIKGK